MTKTLFDFSKSSSIDSWFLINDDVMGGKSSGLVRRSSLGLLFSGHISTQNNGGFSSIRTREFSKNFLSNINGFEITLLGDGRDYDFLIKQDDLKATYRQKFSTTTGQQKVKLSLEDFKATRRGSSIDAPNLNPEKIDELGFILADGNEGNFRCLIYNIKVL